MCAIRPSAWMDLTAHRANTASLLDKSPPVTADAPKVLVRTRGLDTACADGTCPTGCSHLEWYCPNCSSEGAWGAAREVVERTAAEHECPPPTAGTPHPTQD